MAQASGLALGVALAGIAAFGLHMAAQMRRLNIDDAASCLREFRTNRDAGLLAALFLAVAAAV
jgi:4-hydroxybenzoate polyprenyltransferase